MPLRQLSKLIGISYTHLSNIENGRRTPPEHDKLITISNILETTEVEKQHLLELAEQSKMIVHGIPCEISNYMLGNNKAIEAVKTAKSLNYSKSDIFVASIDDWVKVSVNGDFFWTQLRITPGRRFYRVRAVEEETTDIFIQCFVIYT